MEIDDLIQEVQKTVLHAKSPLERMRSNIQLNALQKSVAIRISTKGEADDLLESFKQELFIFPYPFGEYWTWIEIPLGGKQSLSYIVMPPDNTWPHWQIYADPEVNSARVRFLWLPDGRIGPHLDRPWGRPAGPSLWVYQDGEWCSGCEDFKKEPDGKTIHRVEAVDKELPPGLKAQSVSKACSFNWEHDIKICEMSPMFWDMALLPVSIIMYISMAPTRELDKSWQPPRRLGKGKTERSKVGHYQIRPIKKTYLHRRIDQFRTGERRKLEIPSFVRGHHRRAHQRYLSRRGEYTDVKESWVNPHWRGPQWEDLPPHYSLAWGRDPRIESAKHMLEIDEK